MNIFDKIKKLGKYINNFENNRVYLSDYIPKDWKQLKGLLINSVVFIAVFLSATLILASIMFYFADY